MCHLNSTYMYMAVNKKTSKHALNQLWTFLPHVALLKAASLAGMQELKAGLSRTKGLQ